MNQKELICLETGQRIDKYLAQVYNDLTRTQIQGMITNQQVLVNEKNVKSNYILKENDHITLIFLDATPSQVVAEAIPLDIYYEDEDIIVINKPTGMVVHPAPGNYQNTLVNALMHHCTDLSGINGQIRAGIVHRIDKDTSGLLVACKNDLSHKHLSKQFADKKVMRQYVAICSGVIPHNLGKIDAPIARDPLHRQQMTVIENGKRAVTHFQVLKRFEKHTYIELKLETGRTHQIRVHMKYIGFPIVGDPVYGNKKEIVSSGQFLHAKTLGFFHPRTQQWLSFDSPLPDFFVTFMNELESK